MGVILTRGISPPVSLELNVTLGVEPAGGGGRWGRGPEGSVSLFLP